MLTDYDVSSNWGNWQYVAGVGNDPRGEARIFNPVKQAWDYDSRAEYVRSWIPELKGAGQGLETSECFQAWTVPEQRRDEFGLKGLDWVERPLKRIEFTVGKKQSGHNQASRGNRGRYRGNSEHTGGEKGMGSSCGQTRGGYSGRGWAGTRGRGTYYGRGSGGDRNRGWNGNGREGREARTGHMEKEAAARQGDDYASEQT